MHPPSPNLRSGSCCTTRLCQPCCGSGWRRGTFINRWPRSLHRVKTVTRLRALNSPCWGKHRCPRNPSQPWMPLNRKFINICAHICVCVCVWYFSLVFFDCFMCACRGQGRFTAQLFAFLFHFFCIYTTWPRLRYTVIVGLCIHILMKEVFRWVKIQIQRWSIYSVIRVLPQIPGSYIVLSILCVAHYTMISTVDLVSTHLFVWSFPCALIGFLQVVQFPPTD